MVGLCLLCFNIVSNHFNGCAIIEFRWFIVSFAIDMFAAIVLSKATNSRCSEVLELISAAQILISIIIYTLAFMALIVSGSVFQIT